MWIWYLLRAPKNFIKFPTNIHRHSLLSKDSILEHVGKLIVFFYKVEKSIWKHPLLLESIADILAYMFFFFYQEISINVEFLWQVDKVSLTNLEDK